ncbi:MAG: hypothetical protein Q8J68_02060 [Methanolobus sp.]|nr:hypothetical protein [Methanolobus sp.]
MRLLNKTGDNSTVDSGCKIYYPQGISLGNNVVITQNVMLDGRGTINIGDDSLIGFESLFIFVPFENIWENISGKFG